MLVCSSFLKSSIYIELLGLINHTIEIFSAQSASLLEHNVSLLGNHERWHSLNVGRVSQILILVNIYLAKVNIRILIGRLVKDRAERAAWTAPACPEINEDQLIILNDLLKICGSNVMRCHIRSFPKRVSVHRSGIPSGPLGSTEHSAKDSTHSVNQPAGENGHVDRLFPDLPIENIVRLDKTCVLGISVTSPNTFNRRDSSCTARMNVDNGTMPVLNDEVPDDGDFDANRRRGEFDNINPEDFMSGRGNGKGNPPGWLGQADLNRARRQVPIAYVEIVPVRTDSLGRVTQVGSLLRVSDDGSIVERTLIAGRVMYHETLREAIARNIARDLGDLALPVLPMGMQPFTVAEFFPTPGVSEFYDPRQHAIALCYVVPIAGDCKPQDETLDVEWIDPHSAVIETFIDQMINGYGTIMRRALAWMN